MIVRIDDYPHGDYILHKLRPAAHWCVLFDTLVGTFERRAVPYILAVSPGLCSDDDWLRLSWLKYATFAVHGWDHGWCRYGARWRTITDTFGDGGEFAGMSVDEIRPKLMAARQMLRTTLYVAPFNTVNQATLDALADCGYTMIFGGQDTIDWGQTALAYHGMRLDLCVKPFYGPAALVVEHMPTNAVIGLHWIYESAENASDWERIADKYHATR